MNKSSLLILLSLLLLNTGVAYAFEPPNTTIEMAIKQGLVSFIGRIIRIEEVNHREYISDALATIEVVESFYGLEAKTGKQIKLKFHSRLFSDYPNPGFPLEINISDTILFVINRPLDKNSTSIYFNSYYLSPSGKKHIDLAYWAYDDPNNGFNPKKESHTFSYPYYPKGHKREEVLISDLYKWAKERKQELMK